ncbi:hypothetical protein Dda3937_01842 [Dickeya dadantii 3937]|uniref:Uncharacterized protein n=1 Tax=Dickeya dadantii (strain 3937) TaxID=198628 RepID=E0SKD5_DICD3|nr:hypothetical protein Dda3937_01842 [Dickeya dadantii 3937]
MPRLAAKWLLAASASGKRRRVIIKKYARETLSVWYAIGSLTAAALCRKVRMAYGLHVYTVAWVYDGVAV